MGSSGAAVPQVVCYCVESSMSSCPLRGDPSGMVYCHLCPQLCPLPQFSFVFFKTRLSLSLLKCVLTPSLWCVHWWYRTLAWLAVAPLAGTTCSPDWLWHYWAAPHTLLIGCGVGGMFPVRTCWNRLGAVCGVELQPLWWNPCSLYLIQLVSSIRIGFVQLLWSVTVGMHYPKCPKGKTKKKKTTQNPANNTTNKQNFDYFCIWLGTDVFLFQVSLLCLSGIQCVIYIERDNVTMHRRLFYCIWCLNDFCGDKVGTRNLQCSSGSVKTRQLWQTFLLLSTHSRRSWTTSL